MIVEFLYDSNDEWVTLCCFDLIGGYFLWLELYI